MTKPRKTFKVGDIVQVIQTRFTGSIGIITNIRISTVMGDNRKYRLHDLDFVELQDTDKEFNPMWSDMGFIIRELEKVPKTPEYTNRIMAHKILTGSL